MSGSKSGLRDLTLVALPPFLFFVTSASAGMILEGGELSSPALSNKVFTLAAAGAIGVLAYHLRRRMVEAGALALGTVFVTDNIWAVGIRRINGEAASAAVGPPGTLPMFSSTPLIFPLRSWIPLALAAIITVSMWRTHRTRAAAGGALFGYGYGLWLVGRAGSFMSSNPGWDTVPWTWSIAGALIASVGLGLLAVWLFPVAFLWLGTLVPVFAQDDGGLTAYPTAFLDPQKQPFVLLIFVFLAYFAAWRLKGGQPSHG